MSEKYRLKVSYHLSSCSSEDKNLVSQDESFIKMVYQRKTYFGINYKQSSRLGCGEVLCSAASIGFACTILNMKH